MATTIVSNGTDVDVEIKGKPWWQLVLIRTARCYVQSLLGLLGAYSVGAIRLNDVYFAFLAAGFPALISLLQNSAEILSRLDSNDRYATYRA